MAETILSLNSQGVGIFNEVRVSIDAFTEYPGSSKLTYYVRCVADFRGINLPLFFRRFDGPLDEQKLIDETSKLYHLLTDFDSQSLNLESCFLDDK